MEFLLFTTFLFAAPATTQQFHHSDEIRISRLAAPAHQIPKFLVAVFKQFSERLGLLLRQQRALYLEKPLEHEIVLEQAASAPPAQTPELGIIHVTATVTAALCVSSVAPLRLKECW